jgi:2-polyprenyl-3-methyl-5-hydroxy-6-metoxy-1,4-benzoquinol methylase
MAKKSNAKLAVVPKDLRLDIGCGSNKKEGFIGIDQYPMPGVDVVMDVRKRWQYDDSSVEEVHCSHFIEHLTGKERVQFFNELYRVLKPGCKATIITPHWASNRAYGDFTHQWPPVAEMLFYYLSKDWRATNAPHTDAKFNPDGYTCDLECVWGYSMRQDLMTRNQEYQQFAMANYKEACQDTHCTLTAKK